MRDKHRTSSSATLREPRRRLPYRPADARRTVRSVVAERCRARAMACGAAAMEDALLVTSELTTNAILHGGGITGFDVDVDSAGVHVSVSDRSDELPAAAAPVDEHGHTRPGGRGWPIVCWLARDVRVAQLPCGGKRITAVVPLH
ncbi:ATP-binding protein [Streptomyces sp. NPDC052109]|uniref:ATP-binding protein n=1 Tax=Streptomyces sp. NPDC052109 TaxID=3155527 RepID=UPI00343CC9A8